MQMHFFLIRYEGSRFRPTIKLDGLYVFEMPDNFLGENGDTVRSVALKFEPKLFEEEFQILNMMSLRSRCDMNTDGLFLIKSSTKMDRDDIDALLEYWLEEDIIEKELENARFIV